MEIPLQIITQKEKLIKYSGDEFKDSLSDLSSD